MYTDILVATGGSPWSVAAVAYAIAVAARTGARLRILAVPQPPEADACSGVPRGESVDEPTERQGFDLLKAAAAQAKDAGVVAETVCRLGHVSETILQTVAAGPCDLVVLGARMMTGKRLRLGDIANTVAAKAPQPVLIVKHPPAVVPDSPLGRRILVPTGGSPWSDNAVDYAITLAQTEHFSMCLLHVVPGRTDQKDPMATLEGRHILARGETRAVDAGVQTTTLLAYGDVARTIVETAPRQACDGIIMGARGATGRKRLMLGDICNTVSVATPLPVLFVKHFWGG